MNKIEIDREVLLSTWNKAYIVLQPFNSSPFQKTPEYYYNSGVCDVLKLLWDKIENERE